MDTFEQELIRAACKDQTDAVDFVNKAFAYFHNIDDLIDETSPAEFKISVLVQAQEIYLHPVFLRYAPALQAIMRNISDRYAQSVEWEKSELPERAAWADCHRHCGLDLLSTMADLLGGWAHRRKITEEITIYNLMVATSEKKD